VFDPNRLKRKFWAFEAMTLPSLAAQTSKRFEVLLFHSSLLPQPWLQRLQRAAKGYPFLTLIPVGERAGGVMGSATRARYARATVNGTDEAAPFVTARLDDDDSVHPRYVDQRATSSACLIAVHCIHLITLRLSPHEVKSAGLWSCCWPTPLC
jgi:hypothetical protein